ncbi:MAG: DUF1501 domain-containing protein [Planctomycetes bacterium]|nr:DUF1501 domain-containing protein [Planctomycetota bacterium]
MLPSRRSFFSWSGSALGTLAVLPQLAGAKPHHAPKAKRAIQISLVGGMSHIDSFDHKPELTKRHGKPLGADSKPDVFFGQVGLLRKPDWEFKQRGKSGLWVSELFPHVATMADDLTVIRSMHADSANHTPALFVLNSGFQFNGYPALGSWLSYGLGSEADDLPAFVVLPDGRGDANGAASNWSNGFLPAQHQGVVFRGGDAPVRDLFPEKPVTKEEEKDSRAALDKLNALHLDRAGGESDLAARINSYALAAKMQLAVPAVSDLSKEPAKLKTAYGFDDPKTADCGRRCLLARRLLEKGVRFVQVYSGGPIAGSPRTSWDAHENVKENHGAEAKRIDQPVAALLRDLKDRDMLKDTLIIFTTEFGRTPFAQSAGNVVGTGRDHNKYAFSCWLAGAGLKPGTAFGATDDIGWKVAEHPVAWYDFHATVLHLLGIDHEKLTYYHNGIKRRLTNVHGEVVKGVLV